MYIRPSRLAFALAVLGAAALSCGKSDPPIGLVIDPPVADFPYDLGTSFPAPIDLKFTVTDPDAAFLAIAGEPRTPHFGRGDFMGSWPNYTLLVQPALDAQFLPMGTYTDTIRFALARADRSVIGYRDLPIRMVRANPLRVVPSGGTPTAIILAAGLSNTEVLSVLGLDHPWQATSSQPWLTLDAASGTSPSVIIATVDAMGLAEGFHDATVTVRNTATGETAQANYRLQVGPPMLVTVPELPTLTGVVGSPVAPVQVQLRMSNNAAGTWTASVLGDWFTISPTSGTLPGTLTLSVNEAAGPYQPITYGSWLMFLLNGGGGPGVGIRLVLTAP